MDVSEAVHAAYQGIAVMPLGMMMEVSEANHGKHYL